MYPQRDLQRQMDVEQGRTQQHQEEIPLHRLTSRNGSVTSSERELRRRANLRALFDQYDADSDGFLDLKEMKRMIRDHTCSNLPKGAASRILQLGDTDNNGLLDFEEFLRLVTHSDGIIRQYAVRYCNSIIPRREQAPPSDVPDGKYEDTVS